MGGKEDFEKVSTAPAYEGVDLVVEEELVIFSLMTLASSGLAASLLLRIASTTCSREDRSLLSLTASRSGDRKI